MDEQLKEQIQKLIESSKVFLFMKGTPDAPECGFSMRVVQKLKELNIEFKSYNIFESEEVRQGIKEFSNWPTIPQLYINQKFIGGCDITLQMAESGDLKKLI